MLYDGDGRKTPKYTKNEYENQGKISRLVALPSPCLRNESRPTLNGRGILAWWGKKIQGWAQYGLLKADNDFIHVNFQDLQQK